MKEYLKKQKIIMKIFKKINTFAANIILNAQIRNAEE